MSEKPDRSQKTEKPTPKRKKDARKKGQVPKSPELAAWLILLGATWFLPTLLGNLWGTLRTDVVAFTTIAEDPQADRMFEILKSALVGMMTALAPMFAIVVLVSILANLSQVGLVLTGYPLKPKFERINPFSGFKKLFSGQSLWQGTKAFLKLGLLVAIAWPAVKTTTVALVGRAQFDLMTAIPALGADITALVRLVAFMGLFVAAADYGYQRHRHNKDLMMTKQEMKQELKNSDGDPHMKGRMRQMARSLTRNRMLANVADANVVITNPTHLAIALRYEPGNGAPRVLAMGADHMAAKIREAARKADVPIVEAKPIARALWDTCKVDREIPFEMFGPVARVLAFVRRMGGRAALSGAYVLPGV